MASWFAFSVMLVAEIFTPSGEAKRPPGDVMKMVLSNDRFYATVLFQPPRQEPGNIDILVATPGDKPREQRYRPPLVVASTDRDKSLAVAWGLSNGQFWIL